MFDIELKNIKDLVLKRIGNGPVEAANYLSSILKSKRLEMKLTLSDVTKEICSEAFLSKVERNLMDPRNERVKMLCERLDLDYKKLSLLESNKRVEQVLLSFIDLEFDSILNIEEKVCEGVFVAEDEIVKAFKYFIRREFKKLHACILGLDNVKECLSDIELFSVLLIIFEYNLHVLKCNKAFEYMNLLEKLTFKNKKCELYLKEKRFILSCIMGNSDVNYLFEDIRNNFHLFSRKKQFGLMLFYQETRDTTEAYEYLLEMGNDYIPDAYKEEYEYAKALLLTKLEKPLEAMKSILESGYSKVRFITLYAYNLFLYVPNIITDEEFKTQKIKLISLMKISSQNSGDTYHVGFLRLMQYEIDKASSEIVCNFIKNSLVKELNDYCYPLYDEYIRDRYCLLLGKLCRYKDAYMYLLQAKIHLKK